MTNDEALFTAGDIRCVELTSERLPDLQRFFDENAAYFHLVTGAAPRVDEALETYRMRPPDGWPFERKWLLGFEREGPGLVAMADVVVNLFADGVWHIGLFIVGSPLHGPGAAASIYEALESWMSARGARWSRLGIVEGNVRAERFWEKMGYVQIRRRIGVTMGAKKNNIRGMVKSLAGEILRDYLDRVPYDRPE
ncbi:MAG: GNAT family N-acetyltransferase [Usitatibacter sp.]